MSENTAQSQAAAHQQSQRGKRMALGAAAGAAVAAAAIAVALLQAPGGPPRMQAATYTQDTALAVTLEPVAAPQLLADAKACHVPLARVQIWHTDGAPDAVVQLRSGTYLSPAFKLTSTPERIALPFPADYPVGAGTIFVVGKAQAVNVDLSPGARFTDVDGVAPINVRWTTDTPCG